MRDIVNSGYNSSTLPTKSKVVRMNSGTARGEYKSYRDFLESYGDKNSKDDQESVSSTDSGISSSCKLSDSKSNNTSTSSLNSEINGSSSKVSQKSESNTIATRTGSFRNYMESYNNKKFSSVKPNVASKQNIVKSEIVIQVNDPLEQPKNESEKVYMTTINGDVLEKDEDKTDAAINTVPRPSLGNYREIKMALSQCFESQHELNSKINRTTDSSLSQLESHNDEINKILPPPPPPPLIESKINCGDCHSGTNEFIPPPPPPPILDLNNQQLKHTTAKKWEAVKVQNSDSNANQQNQPEKLPANNAAAANLAKILTQHLLPRRRELERLEQNETTNGATTSSLCETTDNVSKCQDDSNQKCKTYVSVMPKLPPQPPKLPSSPPPPIPKQQPSSQNFPQSKSFVPSSPVLTKQVKNGENSAPPKFPVFSPTMSKRLQHIDVTLPRQSQKIADLQKSFSKVENSSMIVQSQKSVTPEVPKLPQTQPPKVISGRSSPSSSGNVDFNTTTVVPITDTATKVSKNDPNVRKLVYNTYRGLLGAYNNKANDMIATLPRNMVREDKGVSKQLESIALQGGLEKLNGRTNPNVEQE
ncbi:hypothetical protein ILUMI_10265 [Ignelater luminosus]|uniref:Uncharacterized protein n=1 Tax=Ignelater luminosus TaxID=2038154 RepID=A0A8K0D2L2_IGNLU|nr:hypothetical protein ILUMI_10265 [Ignelater luminosus]